MIENVWKKAARCGNSACVEVQTAYDGPSRSLVVRVRDSKNVEAPFLEFTAEEWRAFIEGAQRGEFDV